MNLIDKAIVIAAKAHAGQTRKLTDIPYITHPFAVGMLLQKEKCSDEIIAAGILHDTVEDTDVTYEDLTNLFGSKVTSLVRAASEQDKSLSWEERKKHTIEHLKNAELDEIKVIVADKLHNLKSIKEDIETNGEDVWNRFNRGKSQQHWYYSSIVKVLAPQKEEFRLIDELEKVVVDVFGQLDTM
ncbi:HD domain-containing protein [Bacillus luteolus]|uniref:HD domain-containing protein n=1 Tax=Litchfieldia luteola TaxID=682179 RepID=A0ABR9QGF2_9BACI|nr:HD domain-containing protein [Cytobacillus luteolus]MBE4907319.1 HD domain-containing protein [Cytobacillus luteolus]MBP1943865.1 (p)ppGpp synthase/HD superfamily hydrolase [Cytobacillus luteolus]